jgi:hypothetical protein
MRKVMEKQTKSNDSSRQDNRQYRGECDTDWVLAQEQVEDVEGYIDLWKAQWLEATGEVVSNEEARESMYNIATLFRVLDEIDRQRMAVSSESDALVLSDDRGTICVPDSEGGSHGKT